MKISPFGRDDTQPTNRFANGEVDMARKPAGAGNEPGDADKAVTAYTYPARRKHIPPAGLEAHGYIEEARRILYEYNPHLPPVLRSSPDAAAADTCRNCSERLYRLP
jgi:hypothetical protein